MKSPYKPLKFKLEDKIRYFGAIGSKKAIPLMAEKRKNITVKASFPDSKPNPFLTGFVGGS